MLILDPIPTPRFIGRPVEAPKPPPKIHSLTELEAEIVHPRVMATLRVVSQRLHDAQIRHAVVGAIAVGHHGWPRATSDVDLVLGPEAWTTAPDGSTTSNIDLPEAVDGVRVDYLPVDVAGDFLIESFARATVSEGVPIAPIEVVILTKLVRLLTRDHADVVELVKTGLFSTQLVDDYLERHAPMLTPRFRRLVEQAHKEKQRGG
jgi:hypothetical protein